jgi:hypothetical protein
MTDTRVFVFAEDGLHCFPTAEDAAGYMEWVDVEDGGVYEAFFTVEGERLVPHPLNDDMVRLDQSGEVDPDSLKSLLRRERDERGAFTGDPDDPVAVANEMLSTDLAWRWSRRWPRWPRWLDVRLHGTAPPRV